MLMPFGSPPDKWKYTTPGSVKYIKPKDDTAKLVMGQTPGSAVEGYFSTAAAMFTNTDTTGLAYFGNIGYGTTGYIALGGVYISGHMGGTGASPTQTLNGWYLGGHAFFGIDDTGNISTSGASHLVPGAYANATCDAVSGILEQKYFIGGLITPMISFDTSTNAIKFNESLFDSDITFYADTVTALSIDGGTGEISTVSTGAGNGISIDTTASTGTGWTSKSQTGYYNFQFFKSDGSNLLYGQWDGGNFHHHLGGTLYYNIHTYNFCIDGNGNSNVGLIISNGAELKLDASITGASPNIRMGGGSYATSGTPLTTINAFANYTWAWNGSNGYSITSALTVNHVMLSTTPGDSELRFINSSVASVMKIGLLNSQVEMADGTAALPSITFINDLNTGFYRIGTDNFALTTNGTKCVDWSTTTQTYADAYDIATGTTTGTKIGTGTTQKIGFWNTAPIVQPTTGVAAATLTGGGGTTITDTDTFDGYTLKQIVKALRNIGLLA